MGFRASSPALSPLPLSPQDSKKDYRSVLSRGALLSATTGVHILGVVPPEIRQLYDLLTSDFNPLELCPRLGPLFDKLADAPAAMSPGSPVKEVLLTRYVVNLKQVGGSAGGMRRASSWERQEGGYRIEAPT